MASGVVKVGRRTYAIGLFWQPSPSGRVAQAAREAAQQSGHQSDFYCVRAASKSAAIPQYGLGAGGAGHKAGMPALAGSLANVQPGSWAGAFRLREGTWVVVVRDDLIAPDGDFLFDNDETARDRLMQEVALGGVQRIYAPEGWAITNSDPTPLPLLLQDRSDCRLQPVRLPIKLMIYAAAAVAVIGLLVFLALGWQADQERIEQEQAQQAERAKKANVEKPRGVISNMVEGYQWPPADQLYEHTWEKRPTAGDMIRGCKKLLATLQATELGWKRGLLECKDNTLHMVWVREKTPFAVLLDHGTVREDLMNANQSTKGDMLSIRGPELLNDESVLNQHVLIGGWPVTVTRLPDEPPPPPPPNVKDPPPPPPPPWRKRGIKYSGKTPPWELLTYFEGIAGLIVDRISLDGTNWTLEMTIYEKRGG